MKYRIDETPDTTNRDFAHPRPSNHSPLFRDIALALMIAVGVYGWVHLLLGMTL